MKSLLIVDDEYDIGSVLKLAFEMEDFEVQVAFNGKEALELLAGSKLPDVIITDAMMPVMNGYELMRKLRTDPKTRKLPIILISAAQPNKEKSEDGDWNFYFRKPFNLKQLIECVITLAK